MNAIDFLTKEHNKVRKMLSDIDDDSHQFATKKKIFDALGKDLIRHETMEHKIWYPYFKDKLPTTVKHLLREEKSAETAIKKLEEFKTQDSWINHFAKFKEDVEHHAQEEENDLFPEVKNLLTESELEKIGHEMYEFKKMCDRDG